MTAEARPPLDSGGQRTAVRAMVADDWPEVLAAYESGITTRQATFETVAPGWPDWDASHLPRPRLVAADGEAFCGWAALSPVSRRAVYRGVAEVSIYIAETRRGRGVGRLLLAALIEASEAEGIWTLQSSVFPENIATVKLHTSCGFREVGRRERIAQHHGLWRDTVILERRSDRIGTP